jgi:hypothetical protein
VSVSVTVVAVLSQVRSAVDEPTMRLPYTSPPATFEFTVYPVPEFTTSVVPVHVVAEPPTVFVKTPPT